jgi:uncharacterized protein YkwD
MAPAVRWTRRGLARTVLGIVVVNLDTDLPLLAPEEQRFLDLTNSARAEHDLPALQPNNRLQSLARWKAGELARFDLLSHSLPDGSGLAEHLARFGLANAYAGENASVAEPWLGANVDVNHAKLIASPNHLANLLRPEMTHAGMASALGPGGLYSVQIFAVMHSE